MQWAEFAQQQPELAGQVRTRFEQHQQHVLATMALADSARVSGTDARWLGADLCISSDPGAPKAQDLRGDARFALHVNPGDGSRQQGDIRMLGTAEPLQEGPEYEAFASQTHGHQPLELFRLLLEGIEVTQIVPEGVRVTSWTPNSDVKSVIHT